mmetsp:Transcript_60806/g.170014  ORF Transcript_60806/g.170014 Transcript_60806/m.170014 type:complete len:267 (+) Transcript_60806:535-1335(+)
MRQVHVKLLAHFVLHENLRQPELPNLLPSHRLRPHRSRKEAMDLAVRELRRDVGFRHAVQDTGLVRFVRRDPILQHSVEAILQERNRERFLALRLRQQRLARHLQSLVREELRRAAVDRDDVQRHFQCEAQEKLILTPDPLKSGRRWVEDEQRAFGYAHGLEEAFVGHVGGVRLEVMLAFRVSTDPVRGDVVLELAQSRMLLAARDEVHDHLSPPMGTEPARLRWPPLRDHFLVAACPGRQDGRGHAAIQWLSIAPHGLVRCVTTA